MRHRHLLTSLRLFIQKIPRWKNYAIYPLLPEYHDSGEAGHGPRTEVLDKDAELKTV